MDNAVRDENGLTEDQRLVLDEYQKSGDGDDGTVDYKLVASVIRHIINEEIDIIGDNGEGKTPSILVFLPGYEDIMTVYEALSPNDKIHLLTLHSQMVSGEQKRVFHRPPKGKVKVILSTNIAETSLTIDDVAFVVDSGRLKVQQSSVNKTT